MTMAEQARQRTTTCTTEGGEQQSKDNDIGGVAALDEIRQCRGRGLVLIEQGLACEEATPSDQRDIRPNPVAKSLYKLGIDQVSTALAKLHMTNNSRGGGSDPQGSRHPDLERDLIRCMAQAQDRLDVLEAAAAAAAVSTSSEASSLSDSSPPPPMRTTTGLSNMNYVADFARPTVASSLKSTCRPTMDPNPPSPRSTPDASVRSVSSSRSSGKLSSSKKIKKPEMFMSELEKFLSHCIVKKAERTTFSDVVGQEKAKGALNEMVVLPAQRPELFRGLRTPARGLLLFGPPGNGKTLLVKGLAGELKGTTLFTVTASSLTSKFVGEGEKLVRTLFDMATARAPAIIFIDEVDSILCCRKDSDHEASRRLKTEFFAAFDGMSNGGSRDDQQQQRVLVIGATNRPQELDDAALRRFTKRIYIPMPDLAAREMLIIKLLSDHGDPLSAEEVRQVARMTEGYSNSDLTNLAREAALGPLRDCTTSSRTSTDIRSVKADEIRAISMADFVKALSRVRTSVSLNLLSSFNAWNQRYGDVS